MLNDCYRSEATFGIAISIDAVIYASERVGNLYDFNKTTVVTAFDWLVQGEAESLVFLIDNFNVFDAFAFSIIFGNINFSYFILNAIR